jgi:phosphatidylglycerophosphate synthase
LDKLPDSSRFLDLSDYARPFGHWLVQRLLPTPVTSMQLTWAFIITGLIAAVLFAVGTYPAQIIAGLLLILKSGLDAADGALARARKHPSRVGRFADTIGDLVINFSVFLGIAIAEFRRNGSGSSYLLAVLAFASLTWQSTIFNYFYVLYRTARQGDTTSHTEESEPDAYPWDNPRTLNILYRTYRIIFAWQDRLISSIDRNWLGGRLDIVMSKSFMTAVTVMGLGTQLLIIAVCAFIGQPTLAFWLFIVPMNIYWVLLLLVRRRVSRQFSGG